MLSQYLEGPKESLAKNNSNHKAHRMYSVLLFKVIPVELIRNIYTIYFLLVQPQLDSIPGPRNGTSALTFLTLAKKVKLHLNHQKTSHKATVYTKSKHHYNVGQENSACEFSNTKDCCMSNAWRLFLFLMLHFLLYKIDVGKTSPPAG